MDDHPNKNAHVIFAKFESNKKCKEQILQEILAVVCAMLNSNGGEVVIHFDTDSSIPVESTVIRKLEQHSQSIIGLHQTVSKVNFRYDKDSIMIFIKKADSLVTVEYFLYLPSQTQVVELTPLEPLEKVKDIINRKVIPNPVKLGSHCQTFGKNKNCELRENKTCQLKNVKAGASKRTTLADRMTGKGNKFTHYVSAYANHEGGHIYYGIRDDSVVEGEFIPNEKHKEEITKKVEKSINKMIWPEQIGQPKRGEHWEIFFEPVVDENSKPVPSTFVIVIYIAPCLGGVFTVEPECYEMVEGKVTKMSFDTWKKRLLCGKEIIPHPVPRTAWSSDPARKAFAVESEKLRKLINNGDWDALSKECQKPQKNEEMKLVVLSKQITACYRRGLFDEAHCFVKEYKTILPKVTDTSIFEVVGLHIEAALERATGDFTGLVKAVTTALSVAELIEPGQVTAAIFAFAATVSDQIAVEDNSSPYLLSIKTLEHLQHVKDRHFCVDKTQKVHLILASDYLGCNLSGQPTRDSIDTSDISKAKDSIMAVHDSIYEGNALSKYREVQLKLVQSIYYYRLSQVTPDERISFLRSAFDYANEAKYLSGQYNFREMIAWSERNECLCTQELVRANLYK